MANLTGMEDSQAHFLQYKFRVYGFNQRNRQRKYDGVTWGLAGIARAEFVPRVQTVALSPNLTGTYYYFVQPCNSKHFNPNGRNVVGLPSYISAAVSPSAQGVTIDLIPSTHVDPQVDCWQIFRNLNGYYSPLVDDSAQDFYLVATIPIGTTSFNDNVADDIIKANERLRFNTNIPPTFKFGFLFGERMFGFGFDPISVTTSTVATGTAQVITAVALVSNVVTVTYSIPHGRAIGETIVIALTIPNATFDGTFTIVSTPTRNTLTYAKVAGDTTAAGGTATVKDVIDSSDALPDGIIGCYAQLAASSTRYRIKARNSSTQFQTDKMITAADQTLIGFGGSTSLWKIYREAYEIFVSEFMDVESWGPFGEGYRYRMELPGYDDATAGIPYLDGALIFSATNIYQLSGSGPNLDRDVVLSKTPIFAGIGCVGGNAVCTIDNSAFFISERGPAVLEGGTPRLIGMPLNPADYLETLNAAERALCCCGPVLDGRLIEFAFPVHGDTETSIVYCYHRETQTWWPRDGANPYYYFVDDGQSQVQGTGYYIQGQQVIQPDSGTYDLTSAAYTGLCPAGTAVVTFTDSGAAFPTTNGGLVECYVRIYRLTVATGSYSYIGMRRITANTGTAVTWSASGTGGGTLTLVQGDKYYIGPVRWYWNTKTYETPAHDSKVLGEYVTFDAHSSDSPTAYLKFSHTVDDVAVVVDNEVPLNVPSMPLETPVAGAYYKGKIESITGARVRHLVLKTETMGSDEGA